MEQEIIKLLRTLDQEIVKSYNPEKKQVLLKINSELFEQIARELE